MATAAFALAMVVVVAFGLSVVAQEKPTAEFQNVMKSNGATNGRIAKSDNAKAIADDANILVGNAKKLATLWPANSITPDSNAKPEIWQNMADFTAKLKAFEAAATQLAAVAAKGDVQAAKDAQKAVGGACGACHQAFRGPLKGK